MRRLLLLLTSATVFALPALTSAITTCTYDSFDPTNGSAGFCSSSDGRLTEAPYVEAYRIADGEAVALDGKLDDEVWSRAQAATGFRVWDPTRGAEADEQTVFKVAYDEEAIYVAIACLVSDPSNITSQLSRRDNVNGTDAVSLYIDTLHDHSTAYNFGVNPHGVQRDRYVYNDGEIDPGWDAVWSAEAHVDERGWYAEMRIPFSCMRYRNGGDMTWGCNVYRRTHSKGRETSWANWDRETSGFVSRFGEIRGIRGVEPQAQLELLPYVVHRTMDPAAVGEEDELDHFDNLGLDLKYGLTSDLTLNATFQPDFGQVEADPALLNLSPFETYFEEKRPFFVEGRQYYQHQAFNVFYSRRIGTGDENARIRTAGKLTGKTPSGVSVAALYALTDITEEGQAHNPFKSGEQTTQFFVGRFGKEFNEGKQRFNVTQTAVLKPDERDEYGSYATRNAYVTGADFSLFFADRSYSIDGSFVGSMVDPKESESDPDMVHEPLHGTGGWLGLSKRGGTVQGVVTGMWETDKLDLNDAGFLHSNDEIGARCWMGYTHESTDDSPLIRQANVNVNAWRDWLYAGNAGYDIESGEEVWSYSSGHPTSVGGNTNAWMQFNSFWTAWFGVGADPYCSNKYLTRTYDGERGPLMETPGGYFGWWGVRTDGRKDFVFELNGNLNRNDAGGTTDRVGVEVDWTPTTSVGLSMEAGYNKTHAMAGFIGNFASPGEGVGSVSYVFAELDRRTIDLTLRADVLFSRDLSLQLYAQPYLTVGEYSNPKRLAEPDSYEFEDPEGIADFDPGSIGDYDFEYTSVNVNAVLRWEYRPGSTLYVVWKQGRAAYESGSSHGPGFSPQFSARELFDNEPENTFLVKLTYWFSV
ncbi:MAG: hypothetical protein GF400_08725 [Candidatus Eisenbacteria bacterium]|nr:hypothetical protein [Candidatus Eisenbacteria bacterium]